MIAKLDHKDEQVALRIRKVFQASYAVEAKLLGAENNFPPLKRPLSGFLNAETEFYGYQKGEHIAGVIEIKAEAEKIHIQSLVVSPDFFRQGIASELLIFLFHNFQSEEYTVETGAANGPAIALYERFGFKQVKQWMTEVGIEKVAFVKVFEP
ncbi:N-acetyltransferase [Ekhidna sp.]|uniref:GNAT family N-acetyltransferase n=1 Tax=Ekhidna sp. TaxID=2608089 RepID=UPI003298D137